MKNPLWSKIPSELQVLNQWVYWKKINRDGKMVKVPFNARSGHPASSTDSSSWSSFEAACRSSVNGDGIGFVFSGEDGYFGLDMDGHIDMDLANWFGSYCEKSQSGQGCHIIGKGKIETQGREISLGGDHHGYGISNKGRYFIMTGDVILDKPIAECQAQLDEFVLAVAPPIPHFDKQSVDLSKIMATTTADPTILDRIRSSAQADKFEQLWAGVWQNAYASQSDADMALLSILRFWTSGNQAESYSLFRQSGLMREKANRPDYLDRTWAKIGNGEVYTPIEPVPAAFIRHKNSEVPPWRSVTIDHVQAAIEGTIIAPMVKAFRSPTDPFLPLEVGLAKTLPLCGCALAGRNMAPSKKLGDMIALGGDMARIRILTGNGQICNFWTLLVGASASGKDIGGLSDRVSRQFKWNIGTAGSEEGIADAYIAKPTGLLSISEMMNWLDQRHWQHRAAGFLTDAFGRGHFSHAMSKRGECIDRETDYCYPNICASVQPGILETYADKTQLDSGFLGRFLIMRMPKFIAYPRIGTMDDAVLTIFRIVKILEKKKGEVMPADNKYAQKLNEMFDRWNAHPESTWKRLASEYYPRLALLLSMPEGDISETVGFTDEGWKRADVLVQYLFGQAETVFANIHFDPIQSRFESLCSRLKEFIDKKGVVKKSEIGWYLGSGTKVKDRDEAIKELLERGQIQQEQEKTGGRLATVYKRI